MEEIVANLSLAGGLAGDHITVWRQACPHQPLSHGGVQAARHGVFRQAVIAREKRTHLKLSVPCRERRYQANVQALEKFGVGFQGQ
jgi:hypothetical protein